MKRDEADAGKPTRDAGTCLSGRVKPRGAGKRRARESRRNLAAPEGVVAGELGNPTASHAPRETRARTRIPARPSEAAAPADSVAAGHAVGRLSRRRSFAPPFTGSKKNPARRGNRRARPPGEPWPPSVKSFPMISRRNRRGRRRMPERGPGKTVPARARDETGYGISPRSATFVKRGGYGVCGTILYQRSAAGTELHRRRTAHGEGRPGKAVLFRGQAKSESAGMRIASPKAFKGVSPWSDEAGPFCGNGRRDAPDRVTRR